MNKTITVIVVVLVVVVGGVLLFAQKKNSQQNTTPPVSNTTTNADTSPVSGTTSATTSAVKEFKITGTPFKFSLSEIKVKKGDTVRIVFTNGEGVHDWVIDAFNAKTNRLQAGQTQTIEFVADKTGTFEYYCSVGTHRQLGMKGNLIVE